MFDFKYPDDVSFSTNDGEVVTEPNQSYSVAEIVTRYKNNLPIDVQVLEEDYASDRMTNDEMFEAVDLDRLDPVDTITPDVVSRVKDYIGVAGDESKLPHDVQTRSDNDAMSANNATEPAE